MRDELGGQFKLIDYQQLEIVSEQSQQIVASQDAVLAAQKKRLGQLRRTGRMERQYIESNRAH